jgi:hypothetical protein
MDLRALFKQFTHGGSCGAAEFELVVAPQSTASSDRHFRWDTMLTLKQAA